jgi:hypothetical protein
MRWRRWTQTRSAERCLRQRDCSHWNPQQPSNGQRARCSRRHLNSFHAHQHAAAAAGIGMTHPVAASMLREQRRSVAPQRQPQCRRIQRATPRTQLLLLGLTRQLMLQSQHSPSTDLRT